MRRPRFDPMAAPPSAHLDHPSAGVRTGTSIETGRSSRPASTVPHSVVALVGSIDLRAVTAVDAGRLLGGDRLTALHVVESGEDLEDLARRWMRLTCSTVPLRTVDAAGNGGGDVAAAVVDAVTPEDPQAVTTVVLAQLLFARRWHRWLHDRTAAQIAGALEPLAQVRVLRVPVPVPG
ncbi:MAG: hypothetical protein ACXWBN_07865 [Acidimicrobiales bacterium]